MTSFNPDQPYACANGRRAEITIRSSFGYEGHVKKAS